MDGEQQTLSGTLPQLPELSDDFEHVEDAFSLLDLGNAKPVANVWWRRPELLARCVGDSAFYFHRYGAPAAIFARFLGQPLDRHLAAEMVQLAGSLQINVDPGPDGWDGRPEAVIWIKRRQWWH